MSSHFVSGPHRSLINTVWNMWGRCTQLFFLDLCATEFVKCRKPSRSKATALWWCLECFCLRKLVVVSDKYVTTVGDFCSIYKTASRLSHNFHYRWRIDSGGRIKCARSLVSVQTCVVYEHKRVLFLLSHGPATFIRAHAALIKSEDVKW